MSPKLDTIPTDFAVMWVLMLFAVIIFLAKALPKVIKILNNARKKVNDIENLQATIQKNSDDIKILQGQVNMGFQTIQSFKATQEQTQKFIHSSLEENELILRSLMGIVQGLQEIGANGPTKRTEKEIQEFLMKRYHSGIEESCCDDDIKH